MYINYLKIGKRIKKERIKQQLSQMKLADLADLSVPFICYIETGKRKISLESLMRIADALNVSADVLLYDSLPPHCETLTHRYNRTFQRKNESKV